MHRQQDRLRITHQHLDLRNRLRADKAIHQSAGGYCIAGLGCRIIGIILDLPFTGEYRHIPHSSEHRPWNFHALNISTFNQRQ